MRKQETKVSELGKEKKEKAKLKQWLLMSRRLRTESIGDYVK
jgi:hypothetical protein